MTARHVADMQMDPYGGTGAVQSLRQVADLLRRQYEPLEIRLPDDERSFESVPVAGSKSRSGVSAVRGQIVDDEKLAVQIECARLPDALRIPAGALFARLGVLGEKCHVIEPPVAVGEGMTALWLELRIAASPLSFAREAALLSQLEILDKLALQLQSEIPRVGDDREIAKRYVRCGDFVAPVYPCREALEALPDAISDWARETLGFIEGNASVAVECAFPVMTQFLETVLARAAATLGQTLGAVTLTTVNARRLLEISRKAPGILTLPAISLSLGTNVYEMANEINCMLATLSAAGAPVIFSGPHEQLQTVFGGGQGGGADPLVPVLQHAPEVDIDLLTRFAVRQAGRRNGALSPAAEDRLVDTTRKALASFDVATQKRILPAVAGHNVNAESRGQQAGNRSVSRYATTVAARNETLAGISPRPRAARGTEIQNRYTAVLTHPGLADYFAQHILAQDDALQQLIARLVAECLTRPPYQPLRYCAQGTPGTGKSESAMLLARRLDVPYINIDAASMPDYYTAAAQLLGSGRGIVGSYQSGRLEQAAKCHGGAVIEVSDLDHALPSVRSALADLFLQVLETGEGQSAAGGMFSCANLVFAFTMNLPDGMDETVRKRIGFDHAVTRRQITSDVAEHIKRMLSGAFLSRVGTPIVFDPLDGAALAMIVERAIAAAIRSAAARLNAGTPAVTLEDGLGARVTAMIEPRVISFGARALLEHGRCLASRAFLEMLKHTPDAAGRDVRVSVDPAGNLNIQPQQPGA